MFSRTFLRLLPPFAFATFSRESSGTFSVSTSRPALAVAMRYACSGVAPFWDASLRVLEKELAATSASDPDPNAAALATESAADIPAS